ncbi:MFS general substrate transporter [Flagelloscypha sp. PMI_526]|nr:MFS general substrate transporter [Flagelloscypha sp. PMI_526]
MPSNSTTPTAIIEEIELPTLVNQSSKYPFLNQSHPETAIVHVPRASGSGIALTGGPSWSESKSAANEVDSSQTPQDNVHNPPVNHQRAFLIQFISICVAMSLTGWNDASTGPLLPRMQLLYHVNFGLVSMIFVSQSIGYVSGALANVFITEKIGFGKMLVVGSVPPIIASCMQAPAPPFPFFCLAYSLNGFGMAILQGQCISFVAGLRENKEVRIGLMQAAYGAGALLSPIVATQFAKLPQWSFNYLITLGMSIFNFILVVIVFRGRTQEQSLLRFGQTLDQTETGDRSHFRQMMGLRSVHFLAMFIFMYVGTEVTIGGWIVSYIVLLRDGGSSAGYISVGFWGGIMLGRLVLLWVNQKIGERRVLFVYCGLAMGLELIVWFVPSLPGSAVAVGFIGLLMGPFYPIAMTHASKVLPSWLLNNAVAWIGGFGQIRSAVLPFMTGTMSSKFGIQSLQPLLLAMLGTMLVLWACVPNVPRRVD